MLAIEEAHTSNPLLQIDPYSVLPAENVGQASETAPKDQPNDSDGTRREGHEPPQQEP